MGEMLPLRLIGLGLTAVGVIYLIKPDLFKMGIWKKTSIAQRMFGPENYLTYMRVVGVLYIIFGIVLLLITKETFMDFGRSLGL